MTLERKVATAFTMSDEVWLRHANPWSGITRFITVLPLVILSIWSRVWLGWLSIIPIALAIVWTWLNPRIFPKPSSTKNWMSQGVLGERVWLNRDRIPVPMHHQHVPNILSGVAASGGILVVVGLVLLHVWLTLLGFTLTTLGKLWFIDRMVWLYRDVKDVNAEYQSWLY